SSGPQQLASIYRRRGRVEQTIDELSNGHDLNHLVSYRLHPNRIVVGFRLLARNLAIGHQLDAAAGAPTVLREPLAFRTSQVPGLGIFTAVRRTVLVLPLHRAAPEKFALRWTRRVVKLAS